jgi:hypothetical protein
MNWQIIQNQMTRFNKAKHNRAMQKAHCTGPRYARPVLAALSAQRNQSSVEYKVLDKSNSSDVARLAVSLTNEIIERTGIKHFDVDIPLAESLCDKFMNQGQYTVVGAIESGKIVGFGALCESHSLYAEGSFGIVQEFYVSPQFRSQSIV